MAFYHKHMFDILRIKFCAPTMRLAEKIIFQGALKLVTTRALTVNQIIRIVSRNVSRPCFFRFVRLAKGESLSF